MDSIYNHTLHEDSVYRLWESLDAFNPDSVSKLRKPEGSLGKPYTVLMPPPNANAPLHCGHATYSIQDLMIRFKRMQGYDALYLPGTDHAGFETQVVFERKLKEEGKSRFDFDRQTFYELVLNFVKENGSTAINQLKRIGMSADWSRLTFTLDEKALDTVYNTFIKLANDGLVYREGYMVNYSTYHGTTFSDLETEYKDSVSPLYYIKYLVKDSSACIVVATVRPETIYADVAIAVNPKDSRYNSLVGKYVLNPLTNSEIPVIADEYVDIEFGTGALKITPGHDANDFEIGKKHKLSINTVINLAGRMENTEVGVDGLFPKQARVKVAEILKQKGLLDKVDENYQNRVLVDYKDGLPIEPLVIPNWFIKTESLFDSVITAIKSEKVKFNRKLWKKEILRWLEQKKPWPISRQTVFGIRIPAWYDIYDTANDNVLVRFLINDKDVALLESLGEKVNNTNSWTVSLSFKQLRDKLNSGIYSLDYIQKNVQVITAPQNSKYVISKQQPSINHIQETDTFDTWFSSGQWPFTTTGYPSSSDYSKYFPTQFLDSMWDIMFFWIARMIMFSLYLTKSEPGGPKVPFENVYFHGAITDKHGKKMSKSKGNVINPMDYIEKYGADALRIGIMVGGNTSARFSPLDEDKVRGYRNFANKLWNIARYLSIEPSRDVINLEKIKNSEDVEIVNKLNSLIVKVTQDLDSYKFKYAGEAIYQFIWEDFANGYLESIKNRDDKKQALGIAFKVYVDCLKLLHPFMPFVTEAIWQELKVDSKPLIISNWPTV